MKKGTIGTVIRATLRPQDLLPAFLFELERLNPEQASKRNGELIADGFAYSQCGVAFGDGDKWPISIDDAQWFLETLVDDLNECAPAYCYFGAHVGDGSDFGFWPSFEEIEDLPKLEWGIEHGRQPGDYVEVTDHGNLTVYTGAGKPVLELV